jgi:hypothetical protein
MLAKYRHLNRWGFWLNGHLTGYYGLLALKRRDKKSPRYSPCFCQNSVKSAKSQKKIWQICQKSEKICQKSEKICQKSPKT